MLKELLNFDGYSSNLKRNIALLKTLATDETPQKPLIELQIQQILFTLLEKKSYAELAATGDSFLWHSILLYFSQASNHDADSKLSSYVLIHLFDNFFDLLPVATLVNFDLSGLIYLPQINISIDNPDSKNILLEKAQLNKIKTIIGEMTCHYEARIDIAKFEKITLINFNSHMQSSLFKNFIPACEIEKICPLSEDLQSRISNTLRIIKEFDDNLYHDISETINYIIPLHLLENKTRTSFSTAELTGTIFISDGGSLMDFCEALIHEYYHNELNILLQFKSLFNSRDENTYHSPWREDLRPIGGLFHAIFVYVGVVLFYNKALNEKIHHEEIRNQRNNILKKLNVAFQQIDEADLTPLGKELMTKLYSKFIQLVKTENIDISPSIEIEAARKVHGKNSREVLPEFLFSFS